jgi:non-specific serine/threonine protein kinase
MSVLVDIRLGRFRLLLESRQLLAGDEPVALGVRAFDLLVVLVENQGKVVSKETLLQRVWPGLVVEENNLQVQVSALRKLFGPESIQTVPGRGYLFTIPPQSVEAKGTPAPTTEGALPRLLTTFVGREDKLAALPGLLGNARLVTLTGIGGCGKTRLAIELGRRLAPQFADGVRFVDLAPVNSPELVAPELARAAGVVEESVRSIADALVRQLATRRMLLILDNCEHVLDACADLVQRLLTESEHLRVVVTSREALGMSGEQIVAVASLSRPPQGASVEDAAASEAVQLFVNRARLVVPAFELNAKNVAGVVEICQRLDGIALAIELAAGRLRVLSVEQICEKLGDRFRLLTAGNRAVSRHQTLQAALQWSYEHLTPEEQDLLRRVSVFAGGWTLEAAQATCGSGGGEIDLLDRLGRLVDKSLVTVEHRADGAARYAMLETVRQYAQERLQESGDSIAQHDRHLDYFLDFAEAVRVSLPGDTGATIERVSHEIGNLMAAHAWCGQPHVPVERGLELVIKLRRVWVSSHRSAFAIQLYREALGRPGAEQPTALRAEALFSMGQEYFFSGRHADAVAPMTEAVALAKAHGLKSLVVFCLDKMCGVQLRLGRLQDARRVVEDVVEVARDIGDPLAVSCAYFNLAEVLRYEGRFDEAALAYRESEALWTKGDIYNDHADLGSYICLAIERGRLDEACALLLRSIGLSLQMDPPIDPQQDIELASHLASAKGDWARAARLQGAANAFADRTGYARNFWNDPHLAALPGKARSAMGSEAYDRELGLGYAMDLPSVVAEIVAWLETQPRQVAAAAA